MKNPVLFAKYLLLERINVGGMAEVFIAKAFGIEGFERVLAVKKILPTMAADQEFITMFIDEARISVQLNHANIVHIHELGKHDDSFYIAMEYVSGPDLRTILDRFRAGNARMPIAQAAYIASKICEGLDYAHRKKDGRGQDLNIIHRDVSPQNVLISYEGEVKIIDFGIAKAANRQHQTQAGILKGKFAYMSPEQVQGKKIDRRSDIFAVGNILYEMLTGERLFVGGSDFSVVEKVRHAEVPSVREIDQEIPEGLEQILKRALARDVEERYQWASEMQEDLLRFQLVGDSIYSSKNLSVFMKEAFAEDLEREHARMERFSSVSRPPELELSGEVQSPFAAGQPGRGLQNRRAGEEPRPGPALSATFTRPPARPGPPTLRPADEPPPGPGDAEPSVAVDPSLPSFQLAAATGEGNRPSDTFVDERPSSRQRVERGEKVVIGDREDDQDQVDVATMPRPASGKPGANVTARGKAVNGRGEAAPRGPERAEEEDPPPWPSLEGRGETVITSGPGEKLPPLARGREGVRPTSPVVPAAARGPHLAGADAPTTDVSISRPSKSLPKLDPGQDDSDLTTQDRLGAAARELRARLAAPVTPPDLGGAVPLPAPPQPPPELSVEPVTAAGGRSAPGEEDEPFGAVPTQLAIPLPGPAVAVPLPGPAVAVPLPGPAAIPLPPPQEEPSPDAPVDRFAVTEAGISGAPNIPARIRAADEDASDSTIGQALDEWLPTAEQPARTEHDAEPSYTPIDRRPGLARAEAATGPESAAAVDAALAQESEEEVGPHDKTQARSVPELAMFRDEPGEEDALAKTEMRKPEGWSAPATETRTGSQAEVEDAESRAAWEAKTFLRGGDPDSPPEPSPGHGRGRPPPGGWQDVTTTGLGNRDQTTTEAQATPDPSQTSPMEEDEIPPWPSLEGRGETVVAPSPVPPPKKRKVSGPYRAADSTAARPPPGRPKSGAYPAASRVPDGPRTTAERPRALPPRSEEPVVSVVTDLPSLSPEPASRSARGGSSERARSAGPRGPASRYEVPLDRRKMLVVGGAGLGALLIGLVLFILLGGEDTAPVLVEVSPPTALVRIGPQVVANGHVANLAPGEYDLSATAPGYKTRRQRITVGKSQTVVRINLEPLPSGRAPAPETAPPPPSAPAAAPPPTATAARPAPSPPPPPPPPPPAPTTFTARFDVPEGGVEISVGGKVLTSPGARLANLQIGRTYSFTARKPGFKVARGSFQSKGETEVTVPVLMERQDLTAPAPPPPPRKVEKGSLACATSPPGAEIWVDGKPTGRSTPAPPGNPLQLPVGKHKVQFRLNGKLSPPFEVQIKEGGLEMLRKAL